MLIGCEDGLGRGDRFLAGGSRRILGGGLGQYDASVVGVFIGGRRAVGLVDIPRFDDLKIEFGVALAVVRLCVDDDAAVNVELGSGIATFST